MSKKIIISVLALAVILSCTAAADAQNINDCVNPGASPAVLFDLEIKTPGSIFKFENQTRRIPEVGFFPKPITCITIVNLLPDGDDCLTILEGGVGFNYVDLRLVFKPNKVCNYRITIYYDAAA